MKEIQIGNLFALVDDEDYDRINQYNWRLNKHTNSVYAMSGDWYMHERVMRQAPLGFEWDHKNLNGLDNQKNNLRLATRSQNLMNRPLQKNNTSGYKGVDSVRGGYVARIRFNKKLRIIGKYQTKEEAALAYNIKARELFGDFARLNLTSMDSSSEIGKI